MTEALQNFISVLINYLDESRKLYNIPEVNYLSIPFLKQLDTNIYETQINISKSALLNYLSNFENEISGLFNFTDYRLIDLTVSPDKTIIKLKFASKPELPFELIWEIIKNMNYSQIVSFANSNRDYKTYFESTGWKDIFKIKYPDLYEKANFFRVDEKNNKYYQQLLRDFEEIHYRPLTYFSSQLEILIYLIENMNIDPSKNDNNLIKTAASYGALDVIKYLISISDKYGINPAAEENRPLINAVIREHLNVVKYLLSLPTHYRIDYKAQNNYPLKAAIWNKDDAMIEYLKSLF